MVFGVAMPAVYALCAFFAALRFPGAYGPWNNNTLSQLGNSYLNPDGYAVYLIGCALAGPLAAAYFISAGVWRATGTLTQNRVLVLVQILGIAGGIGLFMNAVFPETNYAAHHFFAGVVFNGFAAAALLVPFALRRGDWVDRAVIAIAAIGIVAVIVMFTFPGSHWLEWPPAVMLLLFPPLVALLIEMRPSEQIQKSAPSK
jgi:hypothetical membrane protein